MRRRLIESFHLREHCYHTFGLVPLLVIRSAAGPVSDCHYVVEMLTLMVPQCVKHYFD